jgi:hypothetical protein
MQRWTKPHPRSWIELLCVHLAQIIMNVLYMSRCEKCRTLVNINQVKLWGTAGGDRGVVMCDGSRTQHCASSSHHWRHSIIISKSNCYSALPPFRPSLFTPCYWEALLQFWCHVDYCACRGGGGGGGGSINCDSRSHRGKIKPRIHSPLVMLSVRTMTVVRN